MSSRLHHRHPGICRCHQLHGVCGESVQQRIDSRVHHMSRWLRHQYTGRCWSNQLHCMCCGSVQQRIDGWLRILRCWLRDWWCVPVPTANAKQTQLFDVPLFSELLDHQQYPQPALYHSCSHRECEAACIQYTAAGRHSRLHRVNHELLRLHLCQSGARYISAVSAHGFGIVQPFLYSPHRHQPVHDGANLWKHAMR
jgi:hypothetical protein